MDVVSSWTVYRLPSSLKAIKIFIRLSSQTARTVIALLRDKVWLPNLSSAPLVRLAEDVPEDDARMFAGKMEEPSRFRDLTFDEMFYKRTFWSP